MRNTSRAGLKVVDPAFSNHLQLAISPQLSCDPLDSDMVIDTSIVELKNGYLLQTTSDFLFCFSVLFFLVQRWYYY